MNDMNGAGWTEMNSQGTGTGQFDGSMDVRYDGAWRLYVADAYNSRVVRMDDMSGAGWQELDLYSHCPFFPNKQHAYPIRVNVDTLGHIYVSINLKYFLRVNDISGAGCVQGPSAYWVGYGGIALDPNNWIYLTDPDVPKQC